MCGGARGGSRRFEASMSCPIRTWQAMVPRRRFTACRSLRPTSGRRRRGAAIASISICGRLTLSAPEPALLPREPAEGAPIFTVPWHAEALGIANVLIEGGMFTANEWAEALSREVRGLAGEPDTEETYYRAVLAALERLVAEKSPPTGGSLVE